MRFAISTMTGLLLTAALSLTSCNSLTAKPNTPDDAFARYLSALKSKDIKGEYALMTPEAQDIGLGAMAAELTLIAALDSSKEPGIHKILEKYGVKKPNLATLGPSVDQKARLKELVADVKDKPGCLTEIIAWLQNNASNKEQATDVGFANVADAELVDLKIEDNIASATVKPKFEDVEKTNPIKFIKFKKINGAWLIDIPDMLPSGPPHTAK